MTENPTTTATSRAVGTTDTPAVRLVGVESVVDEVTTLHQTSLQIPKGEIVGIAGGSGAGKTTLLEIMAGVRPASVGQVSRGAPSAFVPQDDIIHRELPLRLTLLHAATLRIANLDAQVRAATVDRVLDELDLVEQAELIVEDLSGGQRKRASLAAEMLTRPELFFLDEPTSGLDPANAAELMRSLRGLVSSGSTVVISTHSPADLVRCDRVIFVAKGGRVVFEGTPDQAKQFFEVTELVEVYEQLNDWPPERRQVALTEMSEHDEGRVRAAEQAWVSPAPSAWRQWSGLVCRNVDLIRGNRLTLAILLGSPVFIISMMAALFPAGAFGADTASSALAIQTLFWMAFNSFFFGITYGLLQIVGEFEIVRRERRIGLHIGAYVASKFAVLLPLLAVVNAAQLMAMELTGRLPDLAMDDRMAMFCSLQLLSAAAVAIGLHASAAVQNSAQATLALPMLCFPQVLFAGAVVPVSAMGWFPEAMSMPLAVRWGFEPLGRILDLGPASGAEAGTAGFEAAFTGSPAIGWVVLGGLSLAGFAATIRTLSRRTSPDRRR